MEAEISPSQSLGLRMWTSLARKWVGPFVHPTDNPNLANDDENEVEDPDAILAFLDTLRPHLFCWHEGLKNCGINIPKGQWMRLYLSFKIPPNQTSASAVAYMSSRVNVDEHYLCENISFLLPGSEFGPIEGIAGSGRRGWLIRASLGTIACPDQDMGPTDAPRLTLLMEGYNQAVCARKDQSGPEYFVPAPDLMDPKRGWEGIRDVLAPIFAGNKDETYFKSLIDKNDTNEAFYLVRRELPLVTAMALWCDLEEHDWAKEAVLRHCGGHMYIPKQWYDMFSTKMTSWLKLHALDEINFQLDTNFTTNVSRVYNVTLIVKFLFVRDHTLLEIKQFP